MVEKVCPCLVRDVEGRRELLVFRHPQAGVQILKGTLEPGERPEAAALRELQEESGIADGRVACKLGELLIPENEQRWRVYLVETERPLPDAWSHYTLDGGGFTFDFFWQPLDAPIDTPWPEVFDRARQAIRAWLDSGREP